MKLDPTVMRTMDAKDFRVLEAVEKGMNNHALVPAPLVATLANLRHGGTGKIISSLLRDKLLSHETKKSHYDGYRLTNAGYDILALWNLKSRGFVAALGDRIGTGKESDVYLAVAKDGRHTVLKFHRLGRTSFRNVRKKRDYFNSKKAPQHQPNSWLFLSRLSAIKEFAFMKALHGVGYPTPTPVAHNRHVVAMSLVRGVPLYQVLPSRISPDQAQSIFQQATGMAVRLAQHGLVHCDLNEFNLLVDMSGIQAAMADEEHDTYVRHSGQSVAPSRGALSGLGPWDKQQGVQTAGYDPPVVMSQPINEEEEEEQMSAPAQLLENGEPKPVVILIDFPQMVSTQHPNAKELYQRDLDCLRRFFEMKLQCRIPEEELVGHLQEWDNIVGDTAAEINVQDADVTEAIQNEQRGQGADNDSCPKLQVRLDVELKASGYSQEDANRDLELFYYEVGPQLITSAVPEEDGSEEIGEDYEDDREDESVSNDADADADADVDDNRVDKDNAGAYSGEGLASDDIEDGDEEGSECVAVIENLGQHPLQDANREQMEEIAKARARRQLEEQKKRGRKKGAFRSRNSNKNYVKGKRVMQDFGI